MISFDRGDLISEIGLRVCRTDAREELRLQLGTLRFDLGVLGEGLGKVQKKEVIDLKKNFFAAVSPFSRACQLCATLTSPCSPEAELSLSKLYALSCSSFLDTSSCCRFLLAQRSNNSKLQGLFCRNA